ncbi:MAG TPA: hypothetical protein VGP72_19600 [Planctomycetota bacterium]|jgi:hypothetical protein
MNKRDLLEEESEEVRRLRQVKKELYGRFKTSDELFAWLRSLEKQPRTQGGKARAHRKTQPAARKAPPARRKPAHKA